MSYVLLFCTAEEAKPMVPKLMNVTKESGYWIPYFLAESRQGPAEGREHLAEGEAFENDFLDAYVDQCGPFQLKEQDNVVIYGYYAGSYDAYTLPKDKKGEIWYTFRIPYIKVSAMCAAIPPYGDADKSWGLYFYRKEELTD
ncbi:hypothetical protein PG996_013484 [Apiospora saccharicola]|uniref:Uncharacterized protein n=1 Tax=Apiospora saccharicola TaxID=335842 RepID=A0ABR1U889_9PEZI